MATDTQRRGDCVRGEDCGKAAHDDPAQRAARRPPAPPPQECRTLGMLPAEPLS